MRESPICGKSRDWCISLRCICLHTLHTTFLPALAWRMGTALLHAGLCHDNWGIKHHGLGQIHWHLHWSCHCRYSLGHLSRESIRIGIFGMGCEPALLLSHHCKGEGTVWPIYNAHVQPLLSICVQFVHKRRRWRWRRRWCYPHHYRDRVAQSGRGACWGHLGHDHHKSYLADICKAKVQGWIVPTLAEDGLDMEAGSLVDFVRRRVSACLYEFTRGICPPTLWFVCIHESPSKSR